MAGTYPAALKTAPVAISANRNSDDESHLFDRTKLPGRGEDGSAVDLALLDLLEQHSRVPLICTVSPTRSVPPFHAAGRDDAAVAVHEHVLARHPEHARGVPDLAADETLVAHQEAR